MSEYQYHEFCSINSPMPKEVRKTMNSLSSRATLTSHGASYVYNYSDFSYDPIEILRDHFDIYFYIANWGTLRLAFKFNKLDINIPEFKNYQHEEVISYIEYDDSIIIDIDLGTEEGFGWTDGEGMLVEMLPIYDELKNKNYQFLELSKAMHNSFLHGEDELLKELLTNKKLSSSQQFILDIFNR